MAETTAAPKRRRTRKAGGATKAKSKSKADSSFELDLPVSFLGVSIGDGTARVGVSVARPILSLSAADRSLCGRRLTGKIVLRPAGEDPNQTTLFDGVDHEVSATFDVKRFGVSPKAFSFGLTFPLIEINVSELAVFAKKEGRLQVGEIAAIPVPTRGNKSDADDVISTD
jgi:hypothetical protein